MNFLQENIDISHLSNYKTKALAKYFVNINTTEDLKNLKYIYENFDKKLIVSWWTNVLFAFDIYNWVIIKNNLSGWSFDENNKTLFCYSNENIWNIAEVLETKYSIDLWHRFIWLPGSVAWAIYGNAWCFWLETECNLLEVTVLDLSNFKIKTLTKQEIFFSYRNSIFKEKQEYFIISAKFDLSKKIEKYHSDVDNIYFRKHKQPKGNSCGSFFANPSGEYSAWYLIENVWIKWYHLWTAYFSDLHANFLMSEDNGNWQDLMELIDLAKSKVKEKFDIELVNEVRIIKSDNI